MLVSSVPRGARPFERGRLVELIDRQLWFFGCDIRHPTGNLLLAHGFVREPAPVDVPGGTSRYELRLATAGGGARLVLWGWGVLWIGDPGDALVMRRHVISPKWRDTAPDTRRMWRYQDIDEWLDRTPSVDRRPAGHRLAEFAAWVVSYERWVRAVTDADWRTRCAEDRPRHIRRRHTISDPAYLEAWQAMAA